MELGLRDVMVSEGEADHEKTFLSSDLLCEVLSRVDALTLAKASCVSSEFRRVCEGEAFWERLCNFRWPSTKEATAKGLILQTGGYRKFYASCYPCLSGKGTAIRTLDHVDRCSAQSLCTPNKVEDEGVCPSDFVSIIDVMYNGQPMLSRTVAGFPGAEESKDWFETCPFQFDLLEIPDEVNGFRKDEEGITTVAIQTEPSAIPSAEEERKAGRLWKALNDHVTVSWILMNKKTGQMANLASWKAVGGLRHWPCEEDFLLHFGTVIPLTGRLLIGAIHCNVAVKVRYFTTETVSGGCRTTIGITELGMKLENVEGARFYGTESVVILHRALSCDRTITHTTVLESFREFNLMHLARKSERIWQEQQRELAAAIISGVGAFFCLCYILL